jgi:hypothetical protein
MRYQATFALILLVAACQKPQHYTTTVEIARVQRFGSDPKAAVMDIELHYVECPGDGRRLIRTDKAFAACGSGLKKGDRVKAELVSKWVADRGQYRSDVLQLAGCAVHLDPKEEANFESYQHCTDLTATGSVVGVQCERARSKELLAKCPWLRRN